MLVEKIKKIIDSLCDILVAKFPIPQDQVDQITISLIFKFMCDMDKQSVSLGGKKSFLTEKFEKYSWDNIVDPQKGGHEKLKLYKEAINSMKKNSNLPLLFRNIFKGASVPLEDPTTFNLFIKDINEFDYINSENLGSAYEYLLSKTGAQGKLGQFRTPRHIIDFIVEMTDPDKDDLIIDPSCGTAGFLISAYQFILNKYKDNKKGDQLSIDELNEISNNIIGYDIEPKMVRTSLVNMYLHDFKTPKIDEYDSLTQDDKWNDFADVFIANPPFFTPKGGIKAHGKFNIKSSKAEVLFVDYMVEHMKPGGKASIIIPEGINFNKQKNFIELRKKILNNGLICVISLPHGIFKPYASVKTHILILNKEISKKKKDILFIEVKNDGYTQTDTRKPIKGEQITDSLKVYKDFINKENYNKRTNDPVSYVVSKKKIKEEKINHFLGRWYDYEYRQKLNLKTRSATLDNMCNFYPGLSPNEKTKEGNFNFIVPAPILKTADHFDYEVNAVCIPIVSSSGHGKADMKRFHYVEGKFAIAETMFAISSKNENKLKTKFLYYILENKIDDLFVPLMKGATNVTLEVNLVKNISFECPSLEVQLSLIKDLDQFKKIIKSCENIIDNYIPILPIEKNWKYKKLKVLFDTSSGGTPKKDKKEYYEGGNIPWMRSGEVKVGYIKNVEGKITETGLKNSSAKFFPMNTVCMAMYGENAGDVGILKFKTTTNQAVCGIFPNKDFLPEFLYYFLRSKKNEMLAKTAGANQPNITQDMIKELEVPDISLDEQKKIIDILEDQRMIIENNVKIKDLYTERFQQKLDEYWKINKG